MPIQIQKTLRTPDKTKEPTPYHLIIKPLNTENNESILKAARKNHQIFYKAGPTDRLLN